MGKDKGKDKQIASGTPELLTMNDTSISWSQPGSQGKGGWEGFCGQTAIANLLTVHEEGETSPHAVSRAADDWTPGSQPDTLMRAIGELAADSSQYELLHGEKDLTSATIHSPIVCLLHWSGTTGYHYVTVVGIRGDEVVFNHWGEQETMSKDDFDKKWGFKENGMLGGVITFFGDMDAYTSIRRKRAAN